MGTSQLTPDGFTFWQKNFLARAALPGVSVEEADRFAGAAVDLWAARKDAMRAASRLGVAAGLGHVLLDPIEASIARKHASKIDNIRALRTTILGVGLKEAKQAVEQYMDNKTWPTEIIEFAKQQANMNQAVAHATAPPY